MSDTPDVTAVSPTPRRFMTGARPTPLHKIAAALSSGRLRVHRPTAAPAQVIYPLPGQLSMWLNDQYGDCVSAEEAAAIAAYSMFCNVPEVFIPDSSVMSFAQAGGFLDGADLLSVVQAMESTGLIGSDGRAYKDGVPATVDVTDEQAFRSAIAANGPLKLGIASSCLPSGAGNQMGWSSFGAASNQGEDHCVGAWHYGPTSALCSAFGWQVPSGAPATVYTIYTWKTVGLVDWAWIQSACGEAYTRTPTDTTIGPAPGPHPPPVPPVPPTPPTPGVGLAGTLTVTSPADAIGTYALGSSGLTPDEVASLTQARDLISALLPSGATRPSPGDLTAIYTLARERRLSPSIDWIRLIADVTRTAADVAAKNWLAVVTVDVPAIIADLGGR